MQQFKCKLPKKLYRKLKVKHEREPKYLEPQNRIYSSTPVIESIENQEFIFDDEKGED